MRERLDFLTHPFHRRHPMSDTLDTATPRRLLVDGRDPASDETVTVSDDTILSVAAADGNGQTFVTGLTDGTATITVAPGAADAGRSEGSDDITVSTTVPATPLEVTLG
jgi:hypothetical protein